MKKVLSALLALMVVFSVFFSVDNVFAAKVTPISDFDYHVYEKESRVTLGKYWGKDKTVVIPSEIEGYPVTTVRNTFYSNNTVEKVVFPDSITAIEGFAFVKMSKIKTLTIPKNVTKIYDGAISDCASLENIYVEAGNSNYKSKGGVLFGEYSKLIAYPIGRKSTTYNIPDGTRGVKVKAFSNCKNLKKVTFPDSIVGKPGNYIGNELFKNCTKLESVTLAKNTRYISCGMFKNCKSLKQIHLPSSIRYIDGHAFENCTALAKINIPSTVQDISDDAFKNCVSLKSIDIPDGVEEIMCGAFSGCKGLTSVDIPKSVKLLETTIFGNCTNLKYIRILNPNVSFYDYIDSAYYSIGDMPIIYGYKNSTAQEHASHFDNIQFKELVDVDGYKVTVSPEYYHYDGSVKKPSVTLKNSKGKAVSSSRYKVVYPSGRKNVGRYTVTVKMTGKYVGEFKKSFTIKPTKSYLTSINSGKGSVVVHWKKTSAVTGYQLQYSTSKNFTNPKYITFNDKNRVGKTITDLKAGKRYYVRVRTYKTVKVNGKSTRIFSNYSKAYSAVAGK